MYNIWIEIVMFGPSHSIIFFNFQVTFSIVRHTLEFHTCSIYYENESVKLDNIIEEISYHIKTHYYKFQGNGYMGIWIYNWTRGPWNRVLDLETLDFGPLTIGLMTLMSKVIQGQSQILGCPTVQSKTQVQGPGFPEYRFI